ncbi:Riboflavin transporter MCH5 [Tolypocladium ophioglossoides CBS 100239]|uniref:Riboflavin transporter MCH5 n=1 Tax=Tolypocladium ophioglossoides (strain CBS 100239) TaxID=1163406 RepID=A0A0L0NKS8_TOLOC|nr:Riboflavin transporter MCH5 [Tolypocladium ophioglossoides CBS 100239]
MAASRPPTLPAQDEQDAPRDGSPAPADQAHNLDGERPDGGLQAWLQVAASFALYFNHLGFVNSFGVFQSYYAAHLLRASPPSAISWIGSLQVFALMALAVVVGPLYDLGHARALLVAGTLLLVAGFVLTSVATRYWHVLLAQGLCMGLDACCLSVPSMAIVPLYFARRRARAMAVGTVGSGLGATLYPLMFERLQARLGFAWAIRAMGLVALVLCVFAIVVIRRPPTPTEKPAWRRGRFSLRWFVDTSAFKEHTFLLYCAAIFFNNLVFFNSPYYLQSYALAHGMQASSLAPYLVALLNASTIPGRLVPSLFDDRCGPLDTYVVVCACTCASVLYWISVSNAAGNVTFAVLYGFFSGGVVSLATVVVTNITPDLGRLGTRLGMVSILKGVGSLVGPPISGAILGATGEYLGIQLFAALGMLMTTVLSVALRIVLVRRHLSLLKQGGHHGVDAVQGAQQSTDRKAEAAQASC